MHHYRSITYCLSYDCEVMCSYYFNSIGFCMSPIAAEYFKLSKRSCTESGLINNCIIIDDQTTFDNYITPSSTLLYLTYVCDDKTFVSTILLSFRAKPFQEIAVFIQPAVVPKVGFANWGSDYMAYRKYWCVQSG